MCAVERPGLDGKPPLRGAIDEPTPTARERSTDSRLTRLGFLKAGGVGLTGLVFPGLVWPAGEIATAADRVVGRRSAIKWTRRILICDIPPFEANGRSEQPTIKDPGTWGSMYGRMVRLADGSWLQANEASLTDAYLHDPNGGLRLHVHRSNNNGHTWDYVATIAEPGRDLDNPQMVQLDDGSILMAMRSVNWFTSYRLPVYKSTDNGRTWEYFSTIDSVEGIHGMYEPHMGFLDNGDLAVMYANERYAAYDPSYSQILSERVSKDGGKTWGPEIWTAYEVGGGKARPGMPVWTRMNDGRYIVVYEVCGVDRVCYVHCKFSPDGVTWEPGYEGHRIPESHGQYGGPYVLRMHDGRLIVTSNTHRISISDDNGRSWYLNGSRPWSNGLWSSMYQTGRNEIVVVNSVERPEFPTRSYNVQLRVGKVLPRAAS